MSIDKEKWFSFAVGFGILFPMFFTLGGGIYRNKEVLSDSGGVIMTLPLPISILTCLVGLGFLISRLREAKSGLAMVVGTALVLLISLWLGGDGVTPPNRKLIMIIQVGLPLMALILGQLVHEEGKQVALAYLTVLSLIVPLQLYFPLATSPWDETTWGHASLHYSDLLSDNLRLFTIYGHIQYVSLIFVCAYGYALTLLVGKYRLWLLMVSIVLFLYVLRSFSYLTIVAYCLLMVIFLGWKIFCLKKELRLFVMAALVFICATAVGGVYWAVVQQKESFIVNSMNAAYGKFKPVLEGTVPSNVQERLADWELFGKRIVATPKTIVLGHPEPMPREIRTSPHNWYIDIAHTFGLIGLLPMLVLIGYTAQMCWRHRSSVSPQTWWLAGIVFYLVIVDSNFKVTLRQPYPGIFAYFMWGLLLSRLSAAAADKRGA